MTAGRALTLAGLAIGAVGLLVQFAISMQAYLADGRDVFGALGAFFSYYTILTNIVLVLIYISELSSARWLALFRLPLVRALMVANIALVALFVYFVLRHLSVLTGLFLVCDIILHYITPAIYIVWWLTTARHGALTPAMLPLMLAPTLVYFFYAMARGAWVAEYPYPILNAINLGYAQVAINAVFMTFGLGVLCLLAILADSWLAKRRAAYE